MTRPTHSERSPLKDDTLLDTANMWMTCDTSQSPIGPCGPVVQLTCCVCLRHVSTACSSSVLFCGEKPGVESVDAGSGAVVDSSISAGSGAGSADSGAGSGTDSNVGNGNGAGTSVVVLQLSRDESGDDVGAEASSAGGGCW